MSPSGHEKRLRLLEATRGIGGGDRCTDCGSLPDGEEDPDTTYEILFPHEWEERGIETPDENVYCETCSQLVFGVLEFPGTDFYPCVIDRRGEE
jgi:hypothetical protein